MYIELESYKQYPKLEKLILLLGGVSTNPPKTVHEFRRVPISKCDFTKLVNKVYYNI